MPFVGPKASTVSETPTCPHKMIHPDPSPSTITMATIWFALCAILVQKHTDLLAVFSAFIGSFALVYLSKNPRLVDAVATAASLAFLLLPRPYMALSIRTGHAAFALWFAFLYGPLPSTLRLTLEAVSLTLGVVVLVVLGPLLTQYTTHVLLWTFCGKAFEWIAQGMDDPNIMQEDSATKEGLETTAISPYWSIHGSSYDLTDFVERHPGGKEAILLGRGRDCTALFESYHPFTTQHELVLSKYKIQDSITNKVEKDLFYDIIKERVYRTLKEQGLDPDRDRTAPPLRLAYYCVVVACVAISGAAHLQGSILGSFCLAFFGWFLGALGHDAGHFAVSHIPKLNDICVWGMSLLCNPILWQHQHTYAHHSHTNEFEHDPDLHHFTMLLRVHRRFKHEAIYKWQRNPLYITFAYTLVVFGTCVWIPLGMLKEGSLYGIVEYTDRKRPWRAFGMMAHLLTYTTVIMIIPFFLCSSWYMALASVIVHISTSGLMFGFFSQVNHLNELSIEENTTSRIATTTTTTNQTKKPCAANSWAAAQVEASNNFCTDSSFWHLFSNGLNLQIEHHLFPGLNHSHLHRIAPVVKATCEEYGVLYKTYDSWGELMRATVQWLDKLSIEA